MQEYGKTKRQHKIHPHNECEICSEQSGLPVAKLSTRFKRRSMKTKKFGPLYAKASTGKIKEWQITAVEEKGKAVINTMAGYVDGKKTTSTKEIKGKNIGKANETTPFEQACFDAGSKANKKRDEGYFDTIKEAEGNEVPLPMLAQKYTERKHYITFPAFVQPKLNGVRCISRMTEDDPEYMSRKGKQYTTLSHLNKEVEDLLCELEVPLDGEIYRENVSFQEILRAVKKERESTDELEYWVYDVVDTETDFEERHAALASWFDEIQGDINKRVRRGKVVLVPTIEIKSEEELMKWHRILNEAGFEGTIIRNKKGVYVLRHRSNDLQKLKDFQDAEFEIVGGEEATGDDKGTVVFSCQTPEGLTFKVRPTGDREQRRQWLRDLDRIIGTKLTVKYQELSEDGIPIFPVGIALRDYE